MTQEKEGTEATESELEQIIKTLEHVVSRKLKLKQGKLREKRTQLQLQRLHLKNFEHNNNQTNFWPTNICFKDFYKKLYSSQIDPTCSSGEDFLK